MQWRVDGAKITMNKGVRILRGGRMERKGMWGGRERGREGERREGEGTILLKRIYR